jgi:predicted nucleic acid-binding protein
MHLLDTAIVWELRGARAGRCDPGVAAWTSSRPRTELFVSALTPAELGVAAAQVARGDKAGSAAIKRWAETRIIAAFEGRVLPVDAAIVRALGVSARRGGGRYRLARGDPNRAAMAQEPIRSRLIPRRELWASCSTRVRCIGRSSVARSP